MRTAVVVSPSGQVPSSPEWTLLFCPYFLCLKQGKDNNRPHNISIYPCAVINRIQERPLSPRRVGVGNINFMDSSLLFCEGFFLPIFNAKSSLNILEGYRNRIVLGWVKGLA
ncbi:hypothetical protein G9A89_006417 [Geosiphon pyriformis]|nr:hypothetical protein G9A89_006417 [Geosiphon pyriformis]